MLTLRVNCPADASQAVQAILRAQPAVSSLSVIEGASQIPQGDLIFADIPRESANEVITALRAAGIDQTGTIVLNDADTWISRAAFDAERKAPGADSDAVVWASVIERAYNDTALTWTFISFMILATALAAIAIVTDSVILVIAAMVLGPEFTAVASLGLALVRRRPQLFRRALRTLIIGFSVSIAVVAAMAFIAQALGLITVDELTRPRPGTSFIYSPNMWSLVVAVIAGAAGVLALTSAHAGGLVGVFISVTTIPASGDAALAIVFGRWSEAAGSLTQLVVNIAGMAIAGWATLALQHVVWNRVTARAGRTARPEQADR
ncbi:MAG: DUF389 domain-containing protein [Candidatus Nanopelagicales bacterium]|nr:DUF389 domain-containing protein [Candidatus Nanopelagicales bacterium]